MCYNVVMKQCPQNHDISGDNAYLDPKGHYQCRVCRKQRYKEWYDRNSVLIHLTDKEKAHLKIEVVDNGCWLWRGLLSEQGYGVYKNRGAHRVMYEMYVDTIPDGLTLDHLCHSNSADCPGGKTCFHRRCVNPSHLEPVSGEENTRRGNHKGKGEHIARVQREKTHCPQAHEYNEANTRYDYTSTKGVRARRCKICDIDKANRYKLRKAQS